ncbi:YeeE/YedE thiosulfate transporter family protein [Luteimonas salinilitoris]|uniref:YeeE/YedE thiosulfate transporter family protein n=1 Tax=Luteimonas salinilitoris TaxID=3237697 RepID=A0ABV4HRA8_9GAMM
MLTIALVTVLAFTVGFIVNRSGTCLVAAAHEVLYKRRAWRVMGLVLAAMVATTLLVPLSWMPSPVQVLAPVFSVELTLIIGAVLFGIGALVNDACLLGSLGRIGNGEVRLVALPAGLATGFLLTEGLRVGQRVGRPSVFSEPTPLSIAAYCLVALGCGGLLAAFIRAERRRGVRPGSGRRMAVIGVTAGLLFAIEPSWTFANLVDGVVVGSAGAAAYLAVMATLAGSVMSGQRLGTFKFEMPTAWSVARTLAAGGLMGAGAALIPGGNDSLLLQSLPGASPSAFVALPLMMAAILLAMALTRFAGGRAFTP